MNLRFLPACLAVLFATLATAQAPDDSVPAPTNVPGAQYPRVYPDGRVTFRLVAPTAQKVQVQANGWLGKGPYDMARDQDGAWTITIPPARPGFHPYSLLIDGVPVNDPSSETFTGNFKQTSGIEVPEPGVDYPLPKDVPHGMVSMLWYHSKVTDRWRRALVYSPPDYERNPRVRYPVLYLQHGGGEDETSWTRAGHANFILDNLIAARKAVPMIVVMDYGYANRPDEPPFFSTTGMPGRDTLQSGNAFEALMLEDLIPKIDATYRTRSDRDHRALAGLSRGSYQALQIGLAHTDTFAWIGAFSCGGLKDMEPAEAFDGAFSDAARFNARMHLVWLGAGTVESQREVVKAFHEGLDRIGVKNVYYESADTAHEWLTWRRDLNEFATKLFR
jgi:enterochelin esterase-like enzyme